MFNLPRYTFPICLLCFGYPTRGQKLRKKTSRFAEQFIIFKDTYKRLLPQELDEMFAEREKLFKLSGFKDSANVGLRQYLRKFNADFSVEMTHSVKTCLKHWTNVA